MNSGQMSVYHTLRKRFRDIAFDALATDLKPLLKNMIIARLAAKNDDINVMNEHLRIARESTFPVHWVNLTCNDKEHKVRMMSDERKDGRMSNLMDPTMLGEIKTRCGSVSVKLLSNISWTPPKALHC